MPGPAHPDQAFWSKPAAGATWMDDLTSGTPDSDEARALDDLARGQAPADRVFHELRDLAPPAPTAGTTGTAGVGDDDDVPDETLPPAATATPASPRAFDIDAVSDDLLPTWSFD
jgi:hypothetical protein